LQPPKQAGSFRGVEIVEIPAHRAEELRAFLAKDPVQNIYPLGILEEHGVGGGENAGALAFYGMLDEGKIVAAVMVGGRGGMVLPCVFDPGSAMELGAFLGDKVRLRGAFGERAAVDALLRGMGMGPPRWSRPQRLFAASADDLGPFLAGLRQATASDLPDVVALSAAAIKEALGEDPLKPNPSFFTRRVEARVAGGRTWVLPENGRLIVKIDVGVKSRYGAEIEGLYTVPDARGRNQATNALGQLARNLLASTPRVSMRVDEKDTGLAAVCRKVGFTALRPQRLVVYG
jgi:hypothetical protein